MMNTPTTIAIMPARGLGDSLLFLIIANNLQRNGYQVTFYSNHIAQLQDWLPKIIAKPTPNKKDITTIFLQHDLVMADSGAVITSVYPPSQYHDLAKRCVFFNMSSRVDSDLIADISDYLLSKTQDKNKLKKLSLFCKADGCGISSLESKSPIVARTVRFCMEIIQLNNVTKNTGLTSPQHLIYRRYPYRIIIHPTSSSVRKNWLPKQFIKLAQLLQKQGWQPVFCVSPNEWPEWNARINNTFLLPKFATVANLAEFIYESGYMIGNDSGTGHLASSLGIPTLSIARKFTKSHPHLRYRPGWTVGKVVGPILRLPYDIHYWQYFISVKKILKTFKRLVAEYSMDK